MHIADTDRIAAAAVAAGARPAGRRRPVAGQPQPAGAALGALVLLMTGSGRRRSRQRRAVAPVFFEAQERGASARASRWSTGGWPTASAQLKRADPKRLVETAGYTSYPVYQPAPSRSLVAGGSPGCATQLSALARLPRTVAGRAGSTWLLAGVDFRCRARAARTLLSRGRADRAGDRQLQRQGRSGPRR